MTITVFDLTGPHPRSAIALAASSRRRSDLPTMDV
jgi:hypothetical protein